MSAPFVPGNWSSVLVGRDRELALLRQHLNAAFAGQGSLVLIGGEAGIGKTALAETICREAEEQGALVLVGRCYDLTETPPYGPWIELFGRYQQGNDDRPLPDAFAVRGTVGEAVSQAALFQQVLDFFAALAAQQPTMLLFDDLHWADPASLNLLRVVARQLAMWPMLILATYRSEAVDMPHPLSVLIPTLVREVPTERLDLRRLPDDSVHALIDRRYGLSTADTTRLSGYVQQRAEGNPFFIGELLRTLQEEAVLRQTAAGWLLDALVEVRVPTLIGQVIGLRIRRLDDDVQRLLAIAAVIGQEVPLAVWQSVAETDAESLLTTIERAEAAHLIAGTRDGMHIRFVHALIRATLYEGTTAARRRHWHQRAGEVLAALAVPDADAVAYHFEQAGDERAVTWLVQAGDAAIGSHAWVTAAQRYEAALAHLDATDANGESAALQNRLHFRIAMMIQHNDPPRAIAHIDAVRQYAIRHQDHALLANALWYRGGYQIFGGALESGLRDTAAGVDALDALTPEEAATRAELEGITTQPQGARRNLAIHFARAGRLTEALANQEKLSRMHQPMMVGGELETENITPGLSIVRALLGQPEAAREAFAKARLVYVRRRGYPSLGFTALVQLRLVALTYYADDLAWRCQLAEEGEQALAQSTGVNPEVPPRCAAVPLLIVEGQWHEAREIMLAACTTKFALIGDHVRGMLGPLARAMGDPDLAWAQVQALLTEGPATRTGTVVFFEALVLQRLAAALALDTGELDTARTWLDMHDAWLAWNGAVLGRAEGHLGWSRYYRACEDRDAAIHHAREALARASDPRQPLALLAAHRYLGDLDRDAGRFAAAISHLTDALTLADACAAPYERARCLLALARLYAATGDHVEACACLGEARAICATLGALPALAHCDQLAGALADAASPPARSYPDGLSEREIEVLRLIAQGLSNPAIAAALFISRRTVNRHIENLYRKIDARNKADATAYALRHDLA